MSGQSNRAKRLKHLCRLNPTKREVAHLPPDTEVSFLPMEKVSERGVLTLSETRSLTEVMNGFTYFRNGDVIVAKITPCFENGKGAECHSLANGIGFGSTEFHVLRPLPGVDSGFIFFLSCSQEFRHLGASLMYGAAGQQRVPEDFLANYEVLLPPLEEQRAIAAFLDRKTAQIDAVVAKKQRLIQRLQEKRQALISHAVTKGLDPHAPMKDSGIEWLKEVPAHWTVKKLKHWVLFLNNRRVPISSEDRAVLAKEYPYYGASGIIDYVDDYIFDESLILIGEDGANLLSRSSRLAFIADGKYWVNNHAHILKPKSGCLKFWSERLESISYVPFVTGSAQPKLTIENLANIEFAAPDESEQEKIGQFVDAVNSRIHAPLEKLAQQITKLQEYRQTLISAAVTGKIDVTQEAGS